jgi:methyltransferase (TIGR00027 family)
MRMTAESAITGVADTALWVATFRAAEGDRADALFHDPLASILAGDRGRKITRSLSRSAAVGWGVVLRTAAIDRLISEALQTGVDTVINLGAGLDTRPYRMDLPAHIRWVEIDLPALVESKNTQLAGHKPACSLERIGLDLLDRSSRQEVFARYGSTSKNTLLITEGVIPYFSNDDAASLAADVLAVSSFRRWILDFDNSGKRKMPKSWAKKLRAAPFLFQVQDWFEFFKHCGWKARTVVTHADEAERVNRPYPFSFPLGLLMYALPGEVRRRILSVGGAVLMEKA